MALVGLSITFHELIMNADRQVPAPVYGPSIGSDNPQTPGVASIACPTPTGGVNPLTQLVCVSCRAAVDSWVTVGASPGDPTQASPVGGRTYVPGINTSPMPTDIFCSPGDKVKYAVV